MYVSNTLVIGLRKHNEEQGRRNRLGEINKKDEGVGVRDMDNMRPVSMVERTKKEHGQEKGEKR
jgi:hypothetical protein